MSSGNGFKFQKRFALALALALAGVAFAQNTSPKKSTPQKPPAQKTTAQKKETPLSKADIQRLWAQADDDLAMNELQRRGLMFEPKESWLAQLPRLTTVPNSRVPKFSAALREAIPPAPSVDTVTAEAPELLAKVKDAAQKRSDIDLEALVDPDLMENKAKIYTLFDKSEYRAHSLGRFSPQEDRQVGVQFFQLTTSQVETLHYILFGTSRGKIVVRDVVTGAEVAGLFLKDEQQVALNKLNLMLRALNDGDDSGLKNLCTQGLYDDLRSLAPDTKMVGTILTRGRLRTADPSSARPSVPLDQKSIRVVVRISYLTRSGKQIQFDVDFERINNDLKVVRLRDVDNKVIAWDPNIDNYLNRRYSLPDNPPGEVDRSSLFMSPEKARSLVETAIETQNAKKLAEYAEFFSDVEPSTGQGFGLKAAAEFIVADYDDAEKDAMEALQRGGTVYFYVLRHGGIISEFPAVILAVSKEKLELRPPAGQSGNTEDIPWSAAGAPEWATGRKIPPTPAPPFLRLEYTADTPKREKKRVEFAAVGTVAAAPEGNSHIPGLGEGYRGPKGWQQNLEVVKKTIEQARVATQQPKKH